jgi:hypothetical protein
MLKKGCPALKVFGYNGTLFDDAEIPILSKSSCKNQAVIEAIRNLTLIQEEKVLKRINYLDLGVSEIGSIYESLLECSPKVFAVEQEIDGQKIPANTFVLDQRGVARKTSGSYYTNPRLIDELIKSALKPVFEEKVTKASNKERGMLSIKVCDPACGSGAFLIAANNFLGKELAKLRTNQVEPSDKELKKAIRDVLQHCIYGVDLNPMATELAKVSLWINSCVEDMPLNFLDHHIKCGNSLIGSTLELLEKGIPTEAFSPLEGDNKEVVKKLKFQNSMQQKDKLLAEFESIDETRKAESYASLSDIAEKTTADVDTKKHMYLSLLESPAFKNAKKAADSWASAFFWTFNKDSPQPPTNGTLRTIKTIGNTTIDKKTLAMIGTLSNQYRFFHWQLEFPDVFLTDSKGFDCVIGNPPWDMIKANSDEFFTFYDPEYRRLNIKDKKKLQSQLCENRVIRDKWKSSEDYFAHITKYCDTSGMFSHQGTGHLNAFKLFIEKFHQITGLNGRIGLIVPSGIYTDEGCTDLRKLLFDKTHLEYLYCFENKEKIFPIHSSFKFVILVAQNGGPTENFTAGFMQHSLDTLSSLQQSGFILSVSLIRSFSPDTLSIMEFTNQSEIILMEKLFLDIPLLGQKLENTWNVVFHRELNKTDDHELLQTQETAIPVFEGKMIHQYYHMYERSVYWLFEKDAINFYAHRGYHAYKEYRLAYRAVASSTNEATLIATIIPKNTGSVNSLRVIELFSIRDDSSCMANITANEELYLVALMNSFVLNYVTRRKVSANLSAFYIYQLPIPRQKSGDWFFEQIIPRAARLICTTEEYSDFWKEVYSHSWNSLSLSQHGTSVLDDWNVLTAVWSQKCGVYGWTEDKHDIENRAQIRCEIEGLIAHLFNLTEEELQYILSTFPIIKEKTPWFIDGTVKEYRRLAELINIKT